MPNEADTLVNFPTLSWEPTRTLLYTTCSTVVLLWAYGLSVQTAVLMLVVLTLRSG